VPAPNKKQRASIYQQGILEATSDADKVIVAQKGKLDENKLLLSYNQITVIPYKNSKLLPLADYAAWSMGQSYKGRSEFISILEKTLAIVK
jgi:hypothetical protein